MTGIKTEMVNPKIKSHTTYKIGRKRLPSVTTVLNVGNINGKWNALMGWQKRLLLQGIDPDKARDEAADIGTLAHAMIEEHLGGPKVDLKDYSKRNIGQASTAYAAYIDWESQHDLKVIATEQALTHPRLRYGGTADLICELNNEFTLIDFKSSNNVYADHVIQLSAYRELVQIKYKKPPKTWILHLGKETPSFADHYYADLKKFWEAFKLCLKLYKMQGDLKI